MGLLSFFDQKLKDLLSYFFSPSEQQPEEDSLWRREEREPFTRLEDKIKSMIQNSIYNHHALSSAMNEPEALPAEDREIISCPVEQPSNSNQIVAPRMS